MKLLLRFSSKRPLNCVVATALLGTILLTLPGCRIPGLRGEEPGRELPDTFSGVVSEENSAHVGIDEFFNDPILTNLIGEGLAEVGVAAGLEGPGHNITHRFRLAR